LIGVALVVAALIVPTTSTGVARHSGSCATCNATSWAVKSEGVGPVRDGNWIAYSTAPAGYQKHGGSDIFMTRPGGKPVLVASRGPGTIWNSCPAFSPNGMLLAFDRTRPGGQAIFVVPVAADGTLGAARLALTVPGRRVHCPTWPSKGSRPGVRDLSPAPHELKSPGGNLVASASDAGIVVSRPDGSDAHLIADAPPSYAIAGWSPSGSELLLMRDVGGGFMMREVSTRAPFVSTQVVAYVRVNDAYSWPGYGDVSWQPIPRG
jgi:Tol biopolymer transport system component